MPDDLKFTDYYHSDKRDHPEVQEEWVASVLSNPTHSQYDRGRMVHWRYIKERGRWLKVIVEGDEVHNAYIVTPEGGRFPMKTNDPMEYARRKLRISYCRDTDTLEIHNGDEIHFRYSVADGLTANLDADGEAAGFTLEKARALLLPHLSEYDAASTKVRLNYQPIVFSQVSPIENTRKTLGRNPCNILNV